MNLNEIAIDPELRDLLPHRTDDKLLRAKILNEGWTEPLHVWTNPPDGVPVLIDGHRRYEIWRTEPDLDGAEPELVLHEFRDKEEAKEWMLKNQDARRNWISKSERTKYIARVYEVKKKKREQQAKDGTARVNVTHKKPRTSEIVGKELGVSEKTVRRAAAEQRRRDEAIEAIQKVDPVFAGQLSSGDIYMKTDDLELLAKGDKTDIRRAVRKIRLGQIWKPQPSIIRDELDREVPESMVQSYHTGLSIQSVARKLDPIKRELKALAESEGGQWLESSLIADTIERLKKLVADAAYWTHCPRCFERPSNNCKRCMGHGFLPKSAKGTLSEEEQELML